MRGAVPDYRGQAAAFSVEPELAALLVGDAPVAAGRRGRRSRPGSARRWPTPALNLRQGAFARRRQWTVDRTQPAPGRLCSRSRWPRSTLVVQVATILRYAFAADRLEAEAAALGGAAPARRARPGFGAGRDSLFEAVRATPNVELTRIDYRPDGSLAATVKVDSPATLAALRQRAEASGLAVEGGALQQCRRPADRRAGAEAGMSELILWWHGADGPRAEAAHRHGRAGRAGARLAAASCGRSRDALDAAKTRHGAAVVALGEARARAEAGGGAARMRRRRRCRSTA